MAGVSCGANHTAAFTQTGELYCWGWGEHGRLGLGHEVRPLAMHGPHDDDEVVSRWCAYVPEGLTSAALCRRWCRRRRWWRARWRARR